ncbi:hypothetical protein CF326_g8062 [Tilletia indica]|uniref:Uncharacterized protein n=1 Tax=Tilletia indica TaxID=43049 RepID=A0A177T7A1_9BASI|nr:hypothetical protein CF326_g8062 [Tilletia indica]KAE8246353.1 hypothetical protein A4X13_0g5831 [Tilletia indica]
MDTSTNPADRIWRWLDGAQAASSAPYVSALSLQSTEHPEWACDKTHLSYQWRVKLFFGWVENQLCQSSSETWTKDDAMRFLAKTIALGRSKLPGADEDMEWHLEEGFFP